MIAADAPPPYTAPSPAVETAEAQAALLESSDPQVAANKRLVYDMYREILQAGRADLVEKYFTPGYIQHNPNVASGRDSLAGFIKGSRPPRPIEPIIKLPLVTMIAERDLVIMIFRRTESDNAGEYTTSWFDAFRIEDGKIAEHWDPALRSPDMLKLDPNTRK